MTKTKSLRLSVITVFILIFLLFTSYISSGKALYITDQGNARLYSSAILKESPIQSNDLLSISIKGLHTGASSLFNSFKATEINYSTSTGGHTCSLCLLLGSNVFIYFPLVLCVKKVNIRSIEEEDGQKHIERLNLNASKIFGSPYYYLKSNDVVLCERTYESKSFWYKWHSFMAAIST